MASPSKRARTGKITDGKTTMRFVSFDPSLQRTVNGYCKGSTPVALLQCQVKETVLSGSRFELMTSPSRTKATKSHKAFRLPADLSDIDPDAHVKISLDKLQDLAVSQFVAVQVKVVQVRQTEEVQLKGTWRTVTKQECVVADISGTARIVLWEERSERWRRITAMISVKQTCEVTME